MTHIYNKRSYSILDSCKFLWNYSKFFWFPTSITLSRALLCCGRCVPRFRPPPFSRVGGSQGRRLRPLRWRFWGVPCWHCTNWKQQLGVPMEKQSPQAMQQYLKGSPPCCPAPLLYCSLQIYVSSAFLFRWLFFFPQVSPGNSGNYSLIW